MSFALYLHIVRQKVIGSQAFFSDFIGKMNS